MKPRNYILSSAIALICAIPSLGLADSISPRTAVQAGYDQQNRAAETKDINLFMKTLAPDFSGVDKDGKSMTRAQARHNMVSLFAMAAHITGQTTIQSFAVKAGKAYVTTKDHDTVVLTDPKSQQSATMVDDEIDTAVWTKVGGIWKLQSEKVVSESDSALPGTALDNNPGQAT